MCTSTTMTKSLWQVIREIAPSSPAGVAAKWSIDASVLVARLQEEGHQITQMHLAVILEHTQSLAPEFLWHVAQDQPGIWMFTPK